MHASFLIRAQLEIMTPLSLLESSNPVAPEMTGFQAGVVAPQEDSQDEETANRVEETKQPSVIQSRLSTAHSAIGATAAAVVVPFSNMESGMQSQAEEQVGILSPVSQHELFERGTTLLLHASFLLRTQLEIMMRLSLLAASTNDSVTSAATAE